MERTTTYTPGDRVRLVCNCPGGRAGEEATVLAVKHTEPGQVQMLTILIDNDPATTHGTAVFEHEVEPVTPTT